MLFDIFLMNIFVMFDFYFSRKRKGVYNASTLHFDQHAIANVSTNFHTCITKCSMKSCRSPTMLAIDGPAISGGMTSNGTERGGRSTERRPRTIAKGREDVGLVEDESTRLISRAYRVTKSPPVNVRPVVPSDGWIEIWKSWRYRWNE